MTDHSPRFAKRKKNNNIPPGDSQTSPKNLSGTTPKVVKTKIKQEQQTPVDSHFDSAATPPPNPPAKDQKIEKIDATPLTSESSRQGNSKEKELGDTVAHQSPTPPSSSGGDAPPMNEVATIPPASKDSLSSSTKTFVDTAENDSRGDDVERTTNSKAKGGNLISRIRRGGSIGGNAGVPNQSPTGKTEIISTQTTSNTNTTATPASSLKNEQLDNNSVSSEITVADETVTPLNDLPIFTFETKTPKTSSPTSPASSSSSKKKEDGVLVRRMRRRRAQTALSIVLPDGTQVLDSYTLATPRRNKGYHTLFKDIPADEPLVNDYGCALQREILIHGRMYISLHHICFHANIFGWTTDVAIDFADIVSIEKKMTALVIPNALLISTSTSKYTFASLLSRDSVYELLNKLWKVSPPLRKNSLAEKFSSENLEINTKKRRERDPTEDSISFNPPSNTETPQPPSYAKPEDPDPGPAPVFIRPLTRIPSVRKLRAPTECDCLQNNEHYSTVALDTTFTGSVEKIYNLMYTSEFFKDFLENVIQTTDIEMGEWASGADDRLNREFSYTKKLPSSMGMSMGIMPKTTKCYLKDECLHKNFDRYVTNLTTTSTPDLPYGGTFVVKTRVCIMWASDDRARVVVTCMVDWNKSNWLIKGAVEKASIEGQSEFFASLAEAIRKYIVAHPAEFHDPSVPFRDNDTGNAKTNAKSNDANYAGHHVTVKSAEVPHTRSPPVPSIVPPPPPTTRPPSTRQAPFQTDAITPRKISEKLLVSSSWLFEKLLVFSSWLLEHALNPSKSTITIVLISMIIANVFILIRLYDASKRMESMWDSNRYDAIYEQRKQLYFAMLDDRFKQENEIVSEWVADRFRRTI